MPGHRLDRLGEEEHAEGGRRLAVGFHRTARGEASVMSAPGFTF